MRKHVFPPADLTTGVEALRANKTASATMSTMRKTARASSTQERGSDQDRNSTVRLKQTSLPAGAHSSKPQAWQSKGSAEDMNTSHASDLPLTFTGKCRLRCLYGAVRLLGFAVASHHPGLPVFSPATHCALTLEALPGARPPSAALRQLRAAARVAMRSHRVRRQARVKVMARFSPDCAVVLLEHLDTPVTRFLLSHPPLSRFFEPQVRRRGAHCALRRPRTARAKPAAAAPVSAQAVASHTPC
ncbi:hypothetical protein Nmel_015837 [Mimus melanotis]